MTLPPLPPLPVLRQGWPPRQVSSISTALRISSNDQSNTTLPQNPAMLVARKQSQAVYKLRISSSLIFILKIN